MSISATTGGVQARTRGAAFFDVDGTLLSVNSGSLYIRYLRRNGLLSAGDFALFVWGFLTYRLGIVNLDRMARLTSRWIAGRTEKEIIDQCRTWYDQEIRPHIRPEIIMEIDKHRDARRLIVLLTSGTHYLNDLIAADLSIEHVVATDLEVRDGRFTGRPIPPICYGSGKLAKARRFAAEKGLRFEDCYFYSDSISDLPMLADVGHPVVVEPDPRLRWEAARRGWERFALGGAACPESSTG